MYKTIPFEPLSQTSYYVEGVVNGNILSKGTCFFIERKEKYYLITNWHVITGKNPVSGDYLGYYAASPEILKVKVLKKQDTIELVDFDVRLYNEDGLSLWLEHPVHKEQVDVVALPVDIPEDKMAFPLEGFVEPFNEDTQVSVKDDVFILGYPFGISAGNVFPIWKRASIASEPIIDIDGLPKIFVDTASRPGMSGSPAIYIEKRQISVGDRPPDESGAKFSSRYMQIVGIYSGRIGAEDELKAQLGIVWKYSVIDQIIKAE